MGEVVEEAGLEGVGFEGGETGLLPPSPPPPPVVEVPGLPDKEPLLAATATGEATVEEELPSSTRSSVPATSVAVGVALASSVGIGVGAVAAGSPRSPPPPAVPPERYALPRASAAAAAANTVPAATATLHGADSVDWILRVRVAGGPVFGAPQAYRLQFSVDGCSTVAAGSGGGSATTEVSAKTARPMFNKDTFSFKLPPGGITAAGTSCLRVTASASPSGSVSALGVVGTAFESLQALTHRLLTSTSPVSIHMVLFPAGGDGHEPVGKVDIDLELLQAPRLGAGGKRPMPPLQPGGSARSTASRSPGRSLKLGVAVPRSRWAGMADEAAFDPSKTWCRVFVRSAMNLPLQAPDDDLPSARVRVEFVGGDGARQGGAVETQTVWEERNPAWESVLNVPVDGEEGGALATGSSTAGVVITLVSSHSGSDTVMQSATIPGKYLHAGRWYNLHLTWPHVEHSAVFLTLCVVPSAAAPPPAQHLQVCLHGFTSGIPPQWLHSDSDEGDPPPPGSDPAKELLLLKRSELVAVADVLTATTANVVASMLRFGPSHPVTEAGTRPSVSDLQTFHSASSLHLLSCVVQADGTVSAAPFVDDNPNDRSFGLGSRMSWSAVPPCSRPQWGSSFEFSRPARHTRPGSPVAVDVEPPFVPASSLPGDPVSALFITFYCRNHLRLDARPGELANPKRRANMMVTNPLPAPNFPVGRVLMWLPPSLRRDGSEVTVDNIPVVDLVAPRGATDDACTVSVTMRCWQGGVPPSWRSELSSSALTAARKAFMLAAEAERSRSLSRLREKVGHSLDAKGRLPSERLLDVGPPSTERSTVSPVDSVVERAAPPPLSAPVIVQPPDTVVVAGPKPSEESFSPVVGEKQEAPPTAPSVAQRPPLSAPPEAPTLSAQAPQQDAPWVSTMLPGEVSIVSKSEFLAPSATPSPTTVSPEEIVALNSRIADMQATIDGLVRDIDQRSAAVRSAGEQVAKLQREKRELKSAAERAKAAASDVDRRMKREVEEIAAGVIGGSQLPDDPRSLTRMLKLVAAKYVTERRANVALQARADAGEDGVRLRAEHAELKAAHLEQTKRMRGLKAKLAKYNVAKDTVKTQEQVIRRLEALLETVQGASGGPPSYASDTSVLGLDSARTPVDDGAKWRAQLQAKDIRIAALEEQLNTHAQAMGEEISSLRMKLVQAGMGVRVSTLGDTDSDSDSTF